MMTMQEQVRLVDHVRSWNKPNVIGAQVPLRTNWNIRLAAQLAESPSDREVVKYLMYGWPLNHDGSDTSVTLKNHQTAHKFASQVTEYINKEMRYGCLLGPFVTPPWREHIAVSPMSTRAKKQSSKRRIIMDLSWPEKASVNLGISSTTYMGHQMNLHYPTVDDLCVRAYRLGPGAKGYRRDLGRAFKQLIGCPSSWPLMGIYWQGAVLFDKTTMMGSRSAPYCCQRTTSFIRHIMNNLNYFVANYVDDFMGLETAQKIWSSYITLGNLLRDLGVKEAQDKAIPPSEIIEFLGVLYNLRNMTIAVTEERLAEFKTELRKWNVGDWFGKKQLQSLLGKMQFVAKCVRPARVLVFRLRNKLTNIHEWEWVDSEMIKDLHWWAMFLPKYNGVSILWMHQKVKEDKFIASDSCLTGMGACHGQQYIHSTFPYGYETKYKIHHLELIAVIIALKIWKKSLTGFRFTMLCDNKAVVDVVNAGHTKDALLQDLMRQLIYVSATNNFEVILKHVSSEQNRIPDVLSRIHLGRKYIRQFKEIIPSDWTRITIPQHMFNEQINW